MTSLRGILCTEVNFGCLNVNGRPFLGSVEMPKAIILMHWAIAPYTRRLVATDSCVHLLT